MNEKEPNHQENDDDKRKEKEKDLHKQLQQHSIEDIVYMKYQLM